MILSVEAEQKAMEMSKICELQDVEENFSSNSARALATAKYIAFENKTQVNVVDEFNERAFGITYIKDLPNKFIENQFKEEKYKLNEGESLFEVNKRSFPVLKSIIEKNNKKTAIILHGVILMNLLKNFCDVEFSDNKFKITHNGNLIFDEILNKPPEIFELNFEKMNLISIKKITV